MDTHHVTHVTQTDVSDMMTAAPQARATRKTAMAVMRLSQIASEIEALMKEQTTILTEIDLALRGDVEISHERLARRSSEPSVDPRIYDNPQGLTRENTMRLEDIIALTGKTKRTVYRWMDDQGFPRPEIVKKTAYWTRVDVVAWWEKNRENVGRWPVI